VSDMILKPQSPLASYHREFDGVTLCEVSGLALVSVAVPLGARQELTNAIESAHGIPLPDVGSSNYSEAGNVNVLGMQPDQLLLAFEYDGDDAVAAVRNRLGNTGYYSDQSDSWAMLRIMGTGCHRALERICMLDIDPGAFPVGAVARTTMEHLGVIILCEGADSFLLLSPRSSAGSFLHAVETSLINTALHR